MISKYKNIFIILSVIVGIVVTAIIFCFTLFTVKDVKLDFRTDLFFATGEKYAQDEIIKKSGIEIGKSVFFLKKSQFEENIEKNFPYLEVINIETVIPSHVIIHLAERQEFYAIAHNGQVLICDDEFKILRIVDEIADGGEIYDSTLSNAIFIPENQLSITSEKIEEGEFLQFEEEGLAEFYNAMLVNGRDRAEMLNLCKQIEVSFHDERNVVTNGEKVEKELQTDLKITTHLGRIIHIQNAGYGLKYKLQKLFAIFSSIMEIEKFYIGNEEYDRAKTTDQSEIDKILSSAEIYIKNYASEYQFDEATDIIYQKYSEKDCYYELVYQGQQLKNQQTEN